MKDLSIATISIGATALGLGIWGIFQPRLLPQSCDPYAPH